MHAENSEVQMQRWSIGARFVLNVVDYIETFYEILQSAEVPNCVDGKLVMVANAQDRFCIFAPRALAPFHANIVDRFLTLRGVPGRYNHQRDEYWSGDPAWTVPGGAQFRLEERRLDLFGFSLCYGGLDLDNLANQLREAGGLRGATAIRVTDEVT
jgi:hypothetical protein